MIRATLSATFAKRIYISFAAARPLSLCVPESAKGHTVPSRGENKEIINGDQCGKNPREKPRSCCHIEMAAPAGAFFPLDSLCDVPSSSPPTPTPNPPPPARHEGHVVHLVLKSNYSQPLVSRLSHFFCALVRSGSLI